MKSKLLHPAVALVAVDGRARSPSAPRGRAALVAAMITIAITTLADDPTISVSARQRYPWNGLVDVHFTITGDAGTKYDTSFTAKDMVGNTNIAMRTIRKADGIAAATKEPLLPGTYSWVWDAAADLPKDFKCDRVTVTGTANEQQPLYMVIDLSGGANASSYPVSYLDAVPSGGWSDTYKTTKLVLRRCPKGSNSAGGSMAKDMWVGIFEVTFGQYLKVRNVDGGYGSGVAKNKPATEMKRAVGNNTLFAGADKFNSLLSSKTSLSKVRLPTKGEWQYVCRAGTKTALNNGTSASAANMNQVGWYKGNSSMAVQVVGMKLPNAWGLYDMHGNVEELTSDISYVVGGFYTIGCGGSVKYDYSGCTSSSTGCHEGDVDCGFRVFAEINE